MWKSYSLISNLLLQMNSIANIQLPQEKKELSGLRTSEVTTLQFQYGKNELTFKQHNRILKIILKGITEPMVMLLFGTTLIYFFLHEPQEGWMMVIAICLVTAISIYQEMRSSKALEALRQLTSPKVRTIRNGKEEEIYSVELVPGDLILLSEGEKVPADAQIISANDLTVNEAILTGESFAVSRMKDDIISQGTILNSGSCKAIVSATGNLTRLGQIGVSIAQENNEKTPMKLQIDKLVRRLALFGICAFLLITILNYTNTGNWIQSLLFGFTLAMAVIPEEIPLAFSSFMALGAYHMSRRGIITRNALTLENLGSITTLCLDKTGTITRNEMAVHFVYDFEQDLLIDLEKHGTGNTEVLYYAKLASEQDPFDEMEKAIIKAFRSSGRIDPVLSMQFEYPLEGKPPMMTHVYRYGDIQLVAGKGAAERIIAVCDLKEKDRQRIDQVLQQLAEQGYRVMGVAGANAVIGEHPQSQNDFTWSFKGLLALYDPPRDEVENTLFTLKNAGIEVKLLTGDYPITVVNIARQVGFEVKEPVYSGSQIMEMNFLQIQEAVRNSNLFARMFPEAKLKVIDALKQNQQIVAMTGDGVNDGPAIKAAHVGIAMGHKGTEVARQAADLVITDDDLGKLTESIGEGRRITDNLKKALSYIISIHIPIIFTASFPLILGWHYPNIFTPVHIIFLELIMGPTCSIFYEREPAEGLLMLSPPRKLNSGFFTKKELVLSFAQGIVIAAGLLFIYHYYMQNHTIEFTRTMVFTTLLLANTFLTFVKRSFSETIFQTIKLKNNLAFLVIAMSLSFLLSLALISPIQSFFGMVSLKSTDFMICFIVSFVTVFWFEAYKGWMN
jgi:ATPase, P-type (transporting), HAD superfamily, subfamily IC